MNILSEILSSRIRAAIFHLLFGFDGKELYMRDLERRSGFSIGAIQTELRKLLPALKRVWQLFEIMTPCSFFKFICRISWTSSRPHDISVMEQYWLKFN